MNNVDVRLSSARKPAMDAQIMTTVYRNSNFMANTGPWILWVYDLQPEGVRSWILKSCLPQSSYSFWWSHLYLTNDPTSEYVKHVSYISTLKIIKRVTLIRCINLLYVPEKLFSAYTKSAFERFFRHLSVRLHWSIPSNIFPIKNGPQ